MNRHFTERDKKKRPVNIRKYWSDLIKINQGNANF